jgi:hypothetical protein
MKEEKIITRISLSYNPPTLKFEFTKGKRRAKFHKNVSMVKYFNSSSERSIDVPSIVEVLASKHDVLNQVPEKMMISVVEKLFSSFRLHEVTNLDPESGLELPTEQSGELHYVDNVDDHTMRVNMKVERGNLILSPLRCPKHPESELK